MIAAWMAYGVVVALLVGVAAVAMERVARLYGYPARWVWVAALVGSVAAPFVAWYAAGRAGASVGSVEEVMLGPVMLVGSAGAVGGGGSVLVDLLRSVGALAAGWDTALIAGWVAVSAAALLYVLGSAGVLVARRRGWRADTVDGVPVLVSEDTGPAVIGFVRSRIVVPRWALSTDATLRRLMLTHEREHVRAGDPALLFAGIVALVLMPWNGALWWQLRRLRLAIEVDCDARVLRRHPDVRRYGALLLEVSRRACTPRVAVTAFSEPRSFLERRIRRMTEPGRPRRRLAWAAGSTVVGALVLVLACETPIPERLMAPDPEPEAAVVATDEEDRDVARLEKLAPPDPSGSGQASREQLMSGPQFTPYTKAPELRNRDEVLGALVRHYPPLLRDAGIGGQVMVWFLVDETGEVLQTKLRESSRHPALDEAALSVASAMQFIPAENRSEPVPVWVALPITFTAREPGEAPSGRAERRPLAADGSASARPAAGSGEERRPYTRAPELINRAAVQQLLQENYPPLLKDAGIGGEATVMVRVDESGMVDRLQIQTSSGHEALDQAALRVASGMEFRPARKDGEPVPAWIALPISFSAR